MRLADRAVLDRRVRYVRTDMASLPAQLDPRNPATPLAHWQRSSANLLDTLDAAYDLSGPVLEELEQKCAAPQALSVYWRAAEAVFSAESSRDKARASVGALPVLWPRSDLAARLDVLDTMATQFLAQFRRFHALVVIWGLQLPLYAGAAEADELSGSQDDG